GVHHAHAAAAAAAGSLDDHWITDVARDAQILVRIIGQRPVRPRHARYAMTLHHADRGYLVAHDADRFRPGADVHEAAVLHALGKVGILGEEPVARMDGNRVGDLRRRDDRRHVEVALRGGWWPDAHRLVCQHHMLEAGVGGRVNGHRLDAELATSAQDPQRDLATVGDDDLLDHVGLFDDEQRLAEFHRIAVAGHDGSYPSRPVGLDL